MTSQDADGARPPEGSDEDGILLVNLGTPDAPRGPEVRRYLREFLSDPRVLDIGPTKRWMLLRVILATRPQKSAEAYAKIWGEDGSPLLVHSQALRDAVAEARDDEVVLAMRYGSPSVAAGLEDLRRKGCDRLVVMPLYPQYAASSTGSTLEKVYAEASKLWNTPYFTVIPPFYDHPAFIDAWAEIARAPLEAFEPDHVLQSFHGLPERHMIKSSEGTHCLASADCCSRIVHANRNCYRAQSYATARAISAALDLGVQGESWSVSFQSRLGRDPWIKPYTDEVLPELATRGVRRLAVMCPAFVADCLETLEEIGMRAKEDFTAAGGEDLVLIPSLNANPGWVRAVGRILDETLGRAG